MQRLSLLRRRLVVLLTVVTATACGSGPSLPRETLDSDPEARGIRLTATEQETPVTTLLQAVSPVDDSVVWASGHRGRWLRTEDGGRRWFAGRGPGGDSLEFRDIDAFGPATAYLLSAGPGTASRIYRTDDGGSSWRLQYLAEHPEAFLDCMAFWDEATGVAYGDAVDGSAFILRTEDGGGQWERVSAPSALPGEGGFAASGTCVVTGEADRAWIATGNGPRARLLSTEDRGRSWSAVDAPVVGGASSGLTAIAVHGSHGVAAGGVIGADTARGRFATVSSDGGRSWDEGGLLALPGPVYGVALVTTAAGPAAVAVGPRGLQWSPDGGRSWIAALGDAFWSVSFASHGTGWAVGPGGRVVRLYFEGGSRIGRRGSAR